MPAESDSEPKHPTDLILQLRWPVVVIVAIVTLAVVSTRACESAEGAGHAPERAVERAVESVEGLAERFRTGRITTTFLAALPTLVPQDAPRLEVATLVSVETFTRTDERRVLFDMVDLGTNVTEIRVPVTYRYHLRLDDPWHIEARDHVCRVDAPRLRASQPPAIHTDRLQRRSERGWLREDPSAQMEALERSITPLLRRRAEAPETLDLVRDAARRQVAMFVRGWLLREEHWRADRFSAITVRFADEEPSSGAAVEPTLVLDEAGPRDDALDGAPDREE